MAIVLRGNDALNINPLPAADKILSLNGSDWLWAVTAVYIVAFVSRQSLPLDCPLFETSFTNSCFVITRSVY